MAKRNKERRRATTSCGAVTWRLNNNVVELLLIKQFSHKDSWGIPKGHMDDGETLEVCALREVREETGVAVRLGVRLSDCKVSLKNEDKTVVSYIAQPINPQAEPRSDDPDSEVADARWVPIDHLPKIHVYQQPLITEAIELLRALVLKEEAVCSV